MSCFIFSNTFTNILPLIKTLYYEQTAHPHPTDNDEHNNADRRVAATTTNGTLVPETPANPAAAAAHTLGNPEQRPNVRWTSEEEFIQWFILLEAINSFKTPGSASMNKAAMFVYILLINRLIINYFMS